MQPLKLPVLHNHTDTERTFYHFSFLKERKVYGFYCNTISGILENYPFLRKDHSHDFYSVLITTGGTGSIKINNSTYSVNPQTVCLISPGQMHSFENLDNAEGYLFFFCQDFYVEEFSFVRLLNIFSYTSSIGINDCNPAITLTDSEFNSIVPLISSVRNEYDLKTNDNNSAIVLRSFLNILLMKLSGFYDKNSSDSAKSDSVMIHSLAHMVDSYFIQEHNLAFYTSAFNITERQLNDICNKNFNCGLKKILTNRLMQEARKLLLSSELSVAEIAYKLNFKDNSYFNKVFRHEIGLTPGRFRDMHKRLVP